MLAYQCTQLRLIHLRHNVELVTRPALFLVAQRFRTASDEKLGGVWERGTTTYIKIQ